MNSNGHTLRNWRESNRHKLAQRALERQLVYQQRKSKELSGHEGEVILAMEKASRRVREVLESCQHIDPGARVIEVGSGAHGLIFMFGSQHCVGIDPLADSYAKLFPHWQRRVPTVAAAGEHLPFADHTFDIVLCDNVVDHAESPSTIAKELVRILAPGGLLYFTVNVHHPLYSVAASLHSTWRAFSVPIEIGPFADHTVHLTPNAAKLLFEKQPIQIIRETFNLEEARERARKRPARHMGDRLKRLFYKNALYELVARRLE